MQQNNLNSLKYKRILLKISGEALSSQDNEIYDNAKIDHILTQIKELRKLGVTIGIVIGGGNIFRGGKASNYGLHRTNADYMGMLATIINAIALKDFLHNVNVKSVIYSSLAVNSVIQGYNREDMLESLQDDKVVIFAGGTGNPYFTTDSGAALRAIEMEADLLVKATKVDGVYDCDPVANSNAQKYKELSFDEAIAKNLKVMDIAAFDLCRTYKICIKVCDLFEPNSLINAALNQGQGTLVHF